MLEKIESLKDASPEIIGINIFILFYSPVNVNIIVKIKKLVKLAFYFYLSIFDEKVAHSVCISDKA